MDGFKSLGTIVNIFQFHQCIAGRMIGIIPVWIAILQVLIAALGGGQRMISVTHSQQNAFTGQVRVFLSVGCAVCRKSLIKSSRSFSKNQPSGNMTAPLHQIEIINFRECFLRVPDRFDQRKLIIIAQHQHMGEFQGGILTDLFSGRDTLQNGSLKL